jgi:hypothetical protein
MRCDKQLVSKIELRARFSLSYRRQSQTRPAEPIHRIHGYQIIEMSIPLEFDGRKKRKKDNQFFSDWKSKP